MLETDVLIIGGGINGVGVAADASLRGLNVVLCEKDDLASGTSSASTKLVHGGLRYLEQGQFSLVLESLKERSILLRRAPHLVHPLKFIFPCTPNTRAPWQIKLGLKIYDWLTPNDDLAPSAQLKLKEKSPLKAEYQTAFSYSDAQTDDARLVILNALLAKQAGAKILTHTECTKAKAENGHWIITLKSDSSEQKIKARTVVNAAGSWVAHILEKVFAVESLNSLCLIKGSHIVVPKLYEAPEAYTLQIPDGRIVFTIPYQEDYTLIGTTDIPATEKNLKPKISSDEISYLIKHINHYFVKQISAEDIVWSYSGLRCLAHNGEENPSRVSREHKLDINLSLGAPILSLFGGKLTSYRAFCSEVNDALAIYFPKLKEDSTKKTPLPGGDLGMDFNEFTKKIVKKYHWLPLKIAHRYAENYGTLTHQILKNTQSIADLGFDFGAGLYQAEVEYLLNEEWVSSVDDILWRRTKLGLKSQEIDLKKLESYLQEKKHAGT